MLIALPIVTPSFARADKDDDVWGDIDSWPDEDDSTDNDDLFDEEPAKPTPTPKPKKKARAKPKKKARAKPKKKARARNTDTDGNSDSDGDDGSTNAFADPDGDGTTAAVDVGIDLESFGITDDGDDDSEPTTVTADREGEISDDRFVFRGWTRSTGWVAVGPDPVFADPTAAVPYRRYGADQKLLLSTRYVRGGKFEVVTSGLVSYVVGLPSSEVGNDPSSGAEVLSKSAVFEAALRDAYVGIYRPKLDLRIGLQRTSWGNSDVYRPNDVLNARDLRDQLQQEAEVTNIPTFAVRGDVPLSLKATLVGVVSPFFTANRLDTFGTPWAIVQEDSPVVFRRMFGSAFTDLAPSMRPQFQPVENSAEKPIDDFRGASAGGALRLTSSSGDLDFYYHYGFDAAPKLEVDPVFAEQLEALPPDQVTGTALDMLLGDAQMRGVEPFSAKYIRRHHVGADAQTVVGSMILRLDAAYDTQKVFTTIGLTGLVLPAYQVVGAVEYQTGDQDELILVEGRYLQIKDAPPDGTLLGMSAENYSVAAKIKFKLNNWVRVDASGVVDRKPFGYFARAEAIIEQKPVSFHLGGLLLGGDPGSNANYYRRNESVYLSIKYAF